MICEEKKRETTLLVMDLPSNQLLQPKVITHSFSLKICTLPCPEPESIYMCFL